MTFGRASAALCLASLVASAPVARAEDAVVILEPYFYRTPVVDPIEGSSKTVMAYYRTAEERLAAVQPSDANAEQKAEMKRESIARARAFLEKLDPAVLRDSHGVVTALRFRSDDATLSSILLVPELENRYADVLGPSCLAAVPNRGTVFLFPRLASNFRAYSTEILSLYHNNAWPVSIELFELHSGKLRSISTFQTHF